VPVDAQQPAAGDPQVAVEAGFGDLPAQLGPFGRGEGVRSGEELGQVSDQAVADLPVAVGLLGVVADDEPVGEHRLAGPGADLLDPQVAGGTWNRLRRATAPHQHVGAPQPRAIRPGEARDGTDGANREAACPWPVDEIGAQRAVRGTSVRRHVDWAAVGLAAT
jgi:hypothetical protein